MAGGFYNGDSNGDKKHYPGKVTWVVVKACVMGAMGGLIFGYDIGVSGGVTSMVPFLKKFFPSVYVQEALDTSTNQYCQFDSQKLTWFTSSLYLAALVASLGASYITKRLGRRCSMLIGGAVFGIGAFLNMFAQNLAMLYIGRILLGVGVGFSVQAVPLYVSEMAPHKHRGAFNVGFQLSITVGILVANLVNFVTPKIFKGDDYEWRASLGIALIPALVFLIPSCFLPNTPNSMIEMGQHEKAKATLCRVRGVSEKDVQEEYDDLVKASEASKAVKHPWRNIIKRQYRPQLVMSILIPFFQQVTGINVVMFYAPELLQTIGFGNDASLLSALITGIINCLATFISIYGTDRWGRRKLFLSGGALMFIFQVLLAVFIGWKFGVSGNVTHISKLYALSVVGFICVFVAAFAFSWGPLGWLVPSEIFPLEIRSAAQSITASVNMFATFLIAQLFLSMLCHMKYGLFIFFAVFVASMSAFIYFFLPETKNIPIEEMNQVWKDHWYWKRFIPDEQRPEV